MRCQRCFNKILFCECPSVAEVMSGELDDVKPTFDALVGRATKVPYLRVIDGG